MKSVLTNDPNVLTWDEIEEKYPHQWVGLINIDWENMSNIRAAVVKYKEADSDELILERVTGKDPDLVAIYTTPNDSVEVSSAYSL